MVRLQILVTQEQYDMLREKSFKEKISISEIVRGVLPKSAMKESGEREKKNSGKIPVDDVKLHEDLYAKSRDGLVKGRGELNADDYTS